VSIIYDFVDVVIVIHFLKKRLVWWWPWAVRF